MVRATKATSAEERVVEVAAAPTTTKEYRERLVAAWDVECVAATENGWCNDGKEQLREMGFYPVSQYTAVVTLGVAPTGTGRGYDAEHIKADIEGYFDRGYFNRSNVVSHETTVEETTKDKAPIDDSPLDEAIALVIRKAKYWLRQYNRNGLEMAVRNALNAAGTPMPERKARKFTLTLDAVSDSTAAELAARMREHLGSGFSDVTLGAEEVTA